MEHDVFTSLVFCASGGMAHEATIFYKRLAEKLSIKQEEHYSVVMGWLRCCLPFALLCSTILCILGSRSSRGHPVKVDDVSLAVSEGGLQPVFD